MAFDYFSKARMQYILTKIKGLFGQANCIASLDANAKLDSSQIPTNVIKTSSTSGLVKNDGTIDTTSYQPTEIGKGLSTNDFTNEDKALIGQTLGNNAVLTTDKTPFLTRQTLNPTGFSGYVREKLVGASYAWNQLVQNGNFDATTGWSATNGVLTVSNNVGTLTRNTATGNCLLMRAVEKVSGHKYAFSVKLKNNVGTNSILLRWYKNGASGDQYMLVTATTLTSSYTTFSGIITSDYTSITGALVIYNTTTTNGNAIDIKDLQIIDLTLAFGSTIADHLYNLSNNGGITKLRDMGCPIDKYTPYGYGLYSVKTSGKKIVGKNLYQGSNITITNTVYVSFILPTPIPAGTYTVSAVLSNNITSDTRLAFRKSDGSALVNVDLPYNASGRSSVANIVLSQPAYILYFYVAGIGVSGTRTWSDIMITPSDASQTYEPYSCTTYPLGNDELRGKFDLVNGEIVASGDVKESNGEITRKYGIVDLGTLMWNKTASGNPFFYANDLQTAGSVGKLECICSFYPTEEIGQSTTNDKCICLANNGVQVRVRDSTYSTKEAFATAMSGVYLIYKKSTPTTEQSTPFADPMSLVGATTEEYIDTRDIPCPVGAERQFMGQSEDVVEIPSSPQSDGKRVLFAQTSGNETQYYFDTPTLYYKEYTVQGDGTKTYGNLLAELKPYYDALSEDEKTYSKVMMRATSSGNECLTFVGNYWYSRMGVNASGLWLDQIDFQYNRYFKQASGGSITDYTNTNAGTNVIALRVLTYTRAES